MFLGSGIALVVVLNMLSAHVFPEDRISRAQIGQVLADAETVNAITLGSSVNRAIAIEQLGANARHAWISGTDVFEAAALLHTLAPRLPKLDTVYLGLPEIFWYRNNSVVSMKTRTRVYKTLAWLNGNPVPGDWKPYAIARYLPLIREDHWAMALRTILSIPRLVERPADADLALLTSEESASLATLGEYSRSFATRACLEIETMRRANEEVGLTAYRAIEQLSDWAARHDVQIVLYRPPVWWELSALVAVCASDVQETYEEYWSSTASLPNVHLYSFENRFEFERTEAYFFDGLHLNQAGARAFTRSLQAALFETPQLSKRPSGSLPEHQPALGNRRSAIGR